MKDPEVEFGTASQVLEECERLSRMSMNDLETIISDIKSNIASDADLEDENEEVDHTEYSSQVQENYVVTSMELLSFPRIIRGLSQLSKITIPKVLLKKTDAFIENFKNTLPEK